MARVGGASDMVASRTLAGHVGHLGTLLADQWLRSRSGDDPFRDSFDLALSLGGRREYVHSPVLVTHSRVMATALARQPLPAILRLDSLPITRVGLAHFLTFAYTGTTTLPLPNLNEVAETAVTLKANILLNHLEICARKAIADPANLGPIINFAFSFPTTHATRTVVLQRAIQEFGTFTANAPLKDLPVAFMGQLLESDELPVDREVDAFHFLLRWIRVNPDSRSNFAINFVLDTIRFMSMGNEEVNEVRAACAQLGCPSVVKEIEDRLSLAQACRLAPPDQREYMCLVNMRPSRRRTRPYPSLSKFLSSQPSTTLGQSSSAGSQSSAGADSFSAIRESRSPKVATSGSSRRRNSSRSPKTSGSASQATSASSFASSTGTSASSGGSGSSAYSTTESSSNFDGSSSFATTTAESGTSIGSGSTQQGSTSLPSTGFKSSSMELQSYHSSKSFTGGTKDGKSKLSARRRFYNPDMDHRLRLRAPKERPSILPSLVSAAAQPSPPTSPLDAAPIPVASSTPVKREKPTESVYLSIDLAHSNEDYLIDQKASNGSK